MKQFVVDGISIELDIQGLVYGGGTETSVLYCRINKSQTGAEKLGDDILVILRYAFCYVSMLQPEEDINNITICVVLDLEDEIIQMIWELVAQKKVNE